MPLRRDGNEEPPFDGPVDEPVDGAVEEAVAVLRRGGLVAFPTETVYGLGAAARDPAAVGKIFSAKGRPTEHPLIVHLPTPDHASEWARDIPGEAAVLMDRFWPGPLTLILERRPTVPDAVTGGLETVGLRVPDHPVATALLAAFGDGIAAPSANRFGSISPTTAAHVALELGARVDLILDGGSCTVGVESTIVDFTAGRPRVLRPGGVPRDALEDALGSPLLAATDVLPESSPTPRAPGTLASHYAPRARVIAAESDRVAARARGEAGRVVVLSPSPLAGFEHIALAAEPEAAARQLYAALHEVDARGFDVAVVALPAEAGLGEAVADRVRRAAAPRTTATPAPTRDD